MGCSSVKEKIIECSKPNDDLAIILNNKFENQENFKVLIFDRATLCSQEKDELQYKIYLQKKKKQDIPIYLKPLINYSIEPKMHPPINKNEPLFDLDLEYVYGYESEHIRQNLYFSYKGDLLYKVAEVSVILDIENNKQSFLSQRSSRQTISNASDSNITFSAFTVTYDRKKACLAYSGKGCRFIIFDLENSNIRVPSSDFIIKNDMFSVDIVRINFNNKILAFGESTGKGNISIYNMENSEIIFEFNTDYRKMCDMNWSKKEGDNTLIIVGIRLILFLDLDKKEIIKGKYDDEKIINFTSSTSNEDGQFFTGGADGYIYSWKKEVFQQKVHAHDSIIQCINYVYNKIFTGGEDQTIKVFDKNLSPLISIPLRSIPKAIDYFNKNLIIGLLDGSIISISESDNSQKNIMLSHSLGCLHGMDIFENNIITVGEDNKIIIYDLSLKKPVRHAEIDQSKGGFTIYGEKPISRLSDNKCSRSVSINIISKEIAIATNEGNVQIRKSINEINVVHKIVFGANKCIDHLQFSPDGDFLLACSYGGSLCLYDRLRSYELINTFSEINSAIITFDWSVNSRFARILTIQYEIFVLDILNRKLINYQSNLENFEKFEKFGKWISTNCLFSWDVEGIHESFYSNKCVTSACISSNKLLIASGNTNGEINLFRYPCRPLGRKKCHHSHSNKISKLKFTKDDKYLLSIGEKDRCLIQWKIISHQNIN